MMPAASSYWTIVVDLGYNTLDRGIFDSKREAEFELPEVRSAYPGYPLRVEEREAL